MSSSINTAKVLVASVPFTDTTAPIMAPAFFKGILTAAGFNCVGIDLNNLVRCKIIDSINYESYLRFFYYEAVDLEFAWKISQIFDYMVQEICKHNPTTVVLSVLHYQCRTATRWLCFLLKKLDPNIAIIIGGPGAFGSGLVTNEDDFVLQLKNRCLINHYISGDGDISLPELLKGNSHYPGIDSMVWQPLQNLDQLAKNYPNYDDYDLDRYSSTFLGILGSRGCVRDCTFCDIHEYWSKFQWRSAESIFQEMLYQNDRYGIRYFKFQDSLINGNVKEYNRLISMLAGHNGLNPANTLYWASYFILRPETQMSDEQWRLTAESGAIRLQIGIENLVEKNRMHLKKKFTNADVDYGLQLAKKYNIPLTILILIGYVTETESDHLESLKWLEDHKHYAKMPIRSIHIGGTLAILPGTWLFRNQEQLGITWKNGDQDAANGNNHLWQIEATGNNYETRIRRFKEFYDHGIALGFDMDHRVIDPQKELENVIGAQIAAHE